MIDTSNSKRYRIEIKHGNTSSISLSANPSEVLPNGIIWSEHGGNSQDLIIVTSKGIELHKISSVRNQCKLSRYIASSIAHYWYNAQNRFLLVASIASTISNSPALFEDVHHSAGDGIVMSGFFLRCDKNAHFPKFELPGK